MRLIPRERSAKPRKTRLGELRGLLDELEEARLTFEAAPIKETQQHYATLNRIRARIEDLFLNGCSLNVCQPETRKGV